VYREHRPHVALAPFVDRLWTRSAAAGPAPPRRILPDGCIDILVDLAGGGRVSAIGTMTRPLVVDGGVAALQVAVRFRPAGAVPFLGVAADALTDRRVDGDDLDRLGWLRGEPLGEASDVDEAVRALERMLLARLAGVPRPDARIAHAVTALAAAEAPSVDAVARALGWSRQHLRRTFIAQVGVGPKEFARVARLQRAVDRLQRGRRGDGARVAADLGYFDQAHMAHDFRALAGVTPAEARSSAGSIFPIRSLYAGA